MLRRPQRQPRASRLLDARDGHGPLANGRSRPGRHFLINLPARIAPNTERMRGISWVSFAEPGAESRAAAVPPIAPAKCNPVSQRWARRVQSPTISPRATRAMHWHPIRARAWAPISCMRCEADRSYRCVIQGV